MDYYVSRYPDYLYHHGVLGQKWGVRRYQNEDGSLTAAGQKHYGIKEGKKANGYNLSVKLDKENMEAANERAKEISKMHKESMAKAKYDYKSKNISDPSNKKQNKLDYKEEKRKIKEQTKENREKAVKENQRDAEAAVRVWSKNTSKGANAIKAVLSAAGAVTMANIAGNASARGNNLLAIGAGSAAGALSGISSTYISNIMAARKLEKKGSLY